MNHSVKKIIREELLKEGKYQDIALDKISQGNKFENLSELNKLVLLGPSGDIPKLKKISLNKIYRELGGTFGHLQIKVRVKDINEQLIIHKFSIEFSAGKEGYIFSYIHYSDKNEPYVTIRFKPFIPNSDYKGGGSYEDIPIMDNIYPIDYDDIDEEFIDYKNKVDYDRKEFLKNFDMEDED